MSKRRIGVPPLVVGKEITHQPTQAKKWESPLEIDWPRMYDSLEQGGADLTKLAELRKIGELSEDEFRQHQSQKLRSVK